jgi:hypothetical protein
VRIVEDGRAVAEIGLTQSRGLEVVAVDVELEPVAA